MEFSKHLLMLHSKERLGFGLIFTNRNTNLFPNSMLMLVLPCLGCAGMTKSSSYFDRARSPLEVYAALTLTNKSLLPGVMTTD